MRFRDHHVQSIFQYIRNAGDQGIVDEWMLKQYHNPTWGPEISIIVGWLAGQGYIYYTGHRYTPSTVRWYAHGFGPAFRRYK